MRTCLWNKPPELSVRVAFAEFEWKCHNFLSKKVGNWDRKILLFRYWKYLVLGLGEVYFLEVDAYLSLKRATTSVWEGHLCWIWLKIPQCFEYKSGGLGSKSFIVKLPKSSYLRIIRNIFSGSWCIRISEMSRHSCPRGSFLLNLSENTTIFWM